MLKRTCLVSLCVVFSFCRIGTADTVLPNIETPDFTGIPALSVLRVIDGDTIVIQGEAGDKVTVRLIGVDTPETVHPSKLVQAYGKQASTFTANLLKGEKVYLITDPQQGTRDRYGRTLAYVYRAPDGLFVNAELIRQGYGHVYTKYPFKHLEVFRKLGLFARKSEKGLWALSKEKSLAEPPVSDTISTIPSEEAVAPPSQPEKQTDADESGVTVYVTRTGKKYHRGTCSYLRKSKILMQLQDAKISYGPCSRCKPPR